MARVYLDNAATTPLEPNVLEAMLPYFHTHYGNPSSIHATGREVRSAIEKSRKKVADLLNCAPGEIIFTSGGTEADNMAIQGSVHTFGVDHIISTKIEHHAVLHTLEHLHYSKGIPISYLTLDSAGNINIEELESILSTSGNKLVSLMHGNNEIGNLHDLDAIAQLCKKYHAIFHSDTVQTMGHFQHDLQKTPVHFIVGSAHKFHGPKGVGFLYMNPNARISPFIHGGAQERNMRGGTENVTGIVGLAKALEIAYSDMHHHRKHIENLKSYFIEKLVAKIPDATFNGMSGNVGNSLYTVLNVLMPEYVDAEMLLFNLDIQQISASGGSACSSGSQTGSHVLAALGVLQNRGSVRFSFSKYNTTDEIDYVIEKLVEICHLTPTL